MVKKWYTTVEYIDIETGEIITKSMYKREYETLKKTKKVEIVEIIINQEIIKHGQIKWQNECVRRRQLRLF